MSQKKQANILVHLAWLQSIVATLGSLYFSEIRALTPCKLCWFQRIFMYPLVFILLVGILKKDQKISHYVLPLSITGLIIAAYHNLIYYGYIAEKTTSCVGISCATKLISWFGISIPIMSLLAFTIITILMLLHKKKIREL